MKKVYVAGPYTKGGEARNVRKALDVADRLLRLGYAPFVPHLTHLWDIVHPQEYERWLEYDFVWIASCDALLRIPGESAGADREVTLAQSLGIPVFQLVEGLDLYFRCELEKTHEPAL